MLRITKSRSAGAAKAYFREALHVADYYAEGQEIAGQWHGLGAARLRLVGPVAQADFEQLIDNRTPDGAKLTPRDRDNRIPGIDFTFSAPKSVSILWALTEDPRIMDAHVRAVRDAMAEVERNMEVRVRAGAKWNTQATRKTGNAIWGEFVHDTARPVDGKPDPLLHTHAYVINATFDETEQRFKAVEIGNIAGEMQYYNAVYLSALARSMKSFGFDIERRGKWWDLAGISRPLIEQFSRRTAEIEAEARARGITKQDSKAELGKLTRNDKSDVVLAGATHDEWRTRLSTRERVEFDKLLRDAARQPAQREVGAVDAWRFATANAFTNASVANEKLVLAEALRFGYGDVTLGEVNAAVSMTALLRGEIDGRSIITTPEILAEERRMIAFARAGRMAAKALGHGNHEIADPRLNEQQRDAIHHIWGSQDRIMILSGSPGVGKTTILTEVVAGLEAAGHRVMAFAPTSTAVEELRDEAAPDAHTIQRLFIDQDMQRELKGAVIIVDEASFLSVPDMARLFDLADRHDARVVLCGDRKQLSSVNRGDALRLLEERAGVRPAQVTEILRQSGDYKRAVEAVDAGNVAKGWQRLGEMGAIIQVPDRERFDALARDYVSERDAGRRALCVAPTHREKDAVAECIRVRLQDHGSVDREEHAYQSLRDTRLQEAERGDARNYAPGQIIQFFQNVPGLRRGSRAEVIGRDETGRVQIRDAAGEVKVLPIDRARHFQVYEPVNRMLSTGDLVRITVQGKSTDGHRLLNGRIYEIAAITEGGDLTLTNGWTIDRSFGHLDYGYVVTSYGAQGRTVDTVLASLGSDAVPAMNMSEFLVDISRGRTACRIYTDDIEECRLATSRAADRGSATELFEGSLDKKLQPPRKDRLMDFSERLARHAARLAKARGRELTFDKEMMREAKALAAAEHLGRIGEAGAELGD